MAGLGGKNWSFEEEATSSDINGYLADQVVMRFANAASRTAGFGGAGEPVLAEGMVTYLDDVNRVEFYNGSSWIPVSTVVCTSITRPASPFEGQLIYETDTDLTLVWNGSAWVRVSGASGDDPIMFNTNQVTTNTTIPSGKNGVSAGPITIASGVTVTVASGSAWAIV